ncbi:MAG: GTPase HflX [Leptospirillia bacterium]
MKSLSGNTGGLKSSQVGALTRLYRRRVPPEQVITPELARAMCAISREIGRQVGVLVDRRGEVQYVLVGDDREIQIPDLSNWRMGHSRLRGLRCLHTHLKGEALTDDDMNDLSGLRLDMMGAIVADRDGRPGSLHLAHVEADPTAADTAVRLPVMDPHHPDFAFDAFVDELESRMGKAPGARDVKDPRERVLLVSAATGRREVAEESLEELAALALSNDLIVVGRMLQMVRRLHPRFLLGQGKVKEAALKAMQLEADLILFDQELAPGQLDAIAGATELKVIDRTQLILDIFSRRAHSTDGKVQVELAQLRYRLPRLGLRQAALSRLTGGIGGRGPGETRLEIDTRRARDRIRRLEKQLDGLSRGRAERRKRRVSADVPIISLVGYTNAGKSTLLNKLTQSDVVAEDMLFATLDTATRRLRFPREREVLITDTVGFIRRLPPDLVRAFAATLDELSDADLLLHVVDVSHPAYEEQIEAVNRILNDLKLGEVPQLLVLNKADRLPPGEAQALARRHKGVAVSALDKKTFADLLNAVEERLWGMGKGEALT